MLYLFVEKTVRSPNHSYRPDGLRSVQGMICHWTATRGVSALAVAEYLARPSVQAAANYVIGEEGLLVHGVRMSQAAWHAGLAHMDFNGDGDFSDKGEMSVNSSTVGVEFCGSVGGPWSNPQMYTAAMLMRRIERRCPNFRPRNVTDHQFVALPHGRKVDVDKSFRCEAMFWWFLHPYSKLPSSNRHEVYKKLPLWAQRNCDEMWKA